jgi:thioredoxin 1
MNNPPTNPERVSPPWLLIIGLLLGAGLLIFMGWESINPSSGKNKSGSRHVVKLTEANWQKEVVESKIPVLVDFWAPWCGPCVALGPTIDKLANQYEGKVKVCKLNVDDAQSIAGKYEIRAIPCMLIFKGGDEPIDRVVGGNSETQLVAAIEKVLAAK